MTDILKDKIIGLGVTGSIACYKAIDLASKLTQSGAGIDVILTRGAREFVTALAFSAITHRSVSEDMFDPRSELSIDHVAIAERADLIVVAPATAHTIAKMANGLADDALTATVLATGAPILVAPAMDAHMFGNPATQENVRTLKRRGVTIVGPASGRLASGLVGKGRMVETAELMGWIRMILGKGGDLAGRKVVVSAGGTQEAIDPVRVVTNNSSGKMGYAIAEAARDRGGEAVVVAAPNALPDPVGVRVVNVNTALDMQKAVTDEIEDADVVIMAAAVSDWRPVTTADQKIKKGESTEWNLEFTKNPDIIAGLPSDKLVKVGFAAETEDLIANAQTKLVSKGLDLIAANDVTATDAGFATDTNRVMLFDREGGIEVMPLMSKYDVGHRILDRVKPMFKDGLKQDIAVGEDAAGGRD
ncbi:MAG: bifunctional phosphopantothenoylcysteine decarboxylase/phosphopantothenate--cysteine ligase CoaBC [SAR202 cluster bacterium]|jgi:phosphopantothenoylcysteine decarboxylase/phosphopantothenate--cysteine ligase|nr:bifunctional phosphopantothenoylcysteine decarboxylase/phosphopantothenate--cysteine ligase CoaBC [SAR202 cluster bacterium]MDP6302666.1 bifunctional phosphopantothenoylcysteine decarboxylase/phosphopantothenate--cysteine ligase CoaBC [SAR202 cluster bacterium]MDP7105143.1 bifunctional phosphopantothenoylcysteine decarboxylase/phosphopantothenate--cysteine ligase CoaBC [SAR202 cluster bacterium]HJO81615.1 bifunctional phosphopantothenoylcysteine decarboxylase/phosphopantothenate--cysteine lig